jgi:hypothetical protein
VAFLLCLGFGWGGVLIFERGLGDDDGLDWVCSVHIVLSLWKRLLVYFFEYVQNASNGRALRFWRTLRTTCEWGFRFV